MSERPATLRRVPTPSDQPRRMADPQGKRSLFSDDVMPPSVGSVALHCSRCDSRSVVSVVQAAKLAMPMMYIPGPGRTDRVWMKCPSCSARSWVKVRIKS